MKVQLDLAVTGVSDWVELDQGGVQTFLRNAGLADQEIGVYGMPAVGVHMLCGHGPVVVHPHGHFGIRKRHRRLEMVDKSKNDVRGSSCCNYTGQGEY